MLINNTKLKSLNTFAIDVQAQCVVIARTEIELINFWRCASKNNKPVLILGEGSNILFLEDYTGSIILNRISGIVIKEKLNFWYLHIGAGEVWNNLVSFCIKKKILGLENLAMIPGLVGSTPIQNIGAYGAELQQFCDYVDVINLKTYEKFRLSAIECQFGYRDSIFKHDLSKHYAIVAVGLKLSKIWQPILTYGVLTQFNKRHITSYQIYHIICTIRHNSLPNLKIHGNAGSFFKNPIINSLKAKQLLNKYPKITYYPQYNGKIKIAAGCLIDLCGLKGCRFGNAVVYHKQALILINYHKKANSNEIISLARHIRNLVAQKFSIWLEPEVRFIGMYGEVDGTRAIS